jgi:hypothetical protein
VTTQETTKANINKLIEFRQDVYENGMLTRRDALFELMDALVCKESVSSFVRLSQSSQFQWKWLSLYAAVEDGELDCEWLRTYLARRAPQKGMCVFPIDGSPWPRPRSQVLDDRQYVYQASSDVNGGTVRSGLYPPRIKAGPLKLIQNGLEEFELLLMGWQSWGYINKDGEIIYQMKY